MLPGTRANVTYTFFPITKSWSVFLYTSEGGVQRKLLWHHAIICVACVAVQQEQNTYYAEDLHFSLAAAIHNSCLPKIADLSEFICTFRVSY